MTTHELKCWPQYFEAIMDGRKPFEARKNDRDFRVDDVLRLREYKPGIGDWHDGEYTGRECERKVTFILEGLPHLQKGYVVLGLACAPTEEVRRPDIYIAALTDINAPFRRHSIEDISKDPLRLVQDVLLALAKHSAVLATLPDSVVSPQATKSEERGGYSPGPYHSIFEVPSKGNKCKS